MKNTIKGPVEVVRSYHLILDIGYHLDLFKTLYVFFFVSRNLVSLSKLYLTRYSSKFGNGCFNLFKHNHIIGYGILSDGSYKLKLDDLFTENMLTLHHNIDIKRDFSRIIRKVGKEWNPSWLGFSRSWCSYRFY